MTTTLIEGSCLCGAVAFSIAPPFRAFQYCHCSRCRKRSGSAHVANVFVPPEQFSWRRGAGEVVRYDLPTAEYWCTAFCRHCGSPMPWLNKPGTAYVVAAGALDSDPGVTPERSIYFGSRAPWYVAPADHERHDTMP